MTPNTEKRAKIGGWPLAVAVAAVLGFLFFIRHILAPFIIAAALAFLLTPAIDWADRRFRGPRWIYATVTLLLVLAILAGLVVIVGNVLMTDAPRIAHRFPQILHTYIERMAKLGGPTLEHSIDVDAVTSEALYRAHAFLGSGRMLVLAGYGIAAIFGGVLSVVILAYFLISGKSVAAGAFWLVPPEYRREVRGVLDKVLPMLWRYFVGLLIVVTYTSTLAWIAFGPLFHIPDAPILAVTVGVLELVPVVGPAASLALVGLTAAQQTSMLGMIGLFGFAIALRLSIDELVSPLVLGKSARIHPAIVIFAFLSGATLFGIIGLLLAVPFAASIKIILATYYAEPVSDSTPAKRRRTGT